MALLAASDEYATAIHNAGHAVIGRVLSMICGGTSTVRDTRSCDHGVIGDSWTILIRWQKLGKVRDPESVIRGQIMTFMAGMEAENVILGGSNHDHVDDRYKIALMLDHFRYSSDIYEARLFAKTRGLIQRHKSTIERLADELVQHTYLSADEIDRFIESARPISTSVNSQWITWNK